MLLTLPIDLSALVTCHTLYVALRLTPCLDLSALVTCHTLYFLFTSLQSAMFLLNSRMGPFSAPLSITLEDPFSRSYGAMLPSSLTRFLSRALVSLYPPTCVGFGTASRSVGRCFSRKHGCMNLHADKSARSARQFSAVQGITINPLHCPSPTTSFEPFRPVQEC